MTWREEPEEARADAGGVLTEARKYGVLPMTTACSSASTVRRSAGPT